LQLGSTGDISVLGDGAAWIWDMMRAEFGKVRECLDIYHRMTVLCASRYSDHWQDYWNNAK
jgi:hypothetical protein